MQQENPLAKKKSELKTIAEIMKMHYTVRQVSNIFLVQLVEHVYNVNKSSFLSKGNAVQFFS